METYTHRAGRTGRMGKEGYVITLVTHPEELKKLKKFATVREIVLKNQDTKRHSLLNARKRRRPTA